MALCIYKAMASGSNRQWSADQQFIEEITILKRLFIDMGATENVYAMTKALKYLLMVTRPKLTKLKPIEEAKRIKWVEDNLHSVQFFNPEGRVVETDGTRYNKKQLMTYLEETFDLLLAKLQKAGVYTRSNTESKEALGDFSGS